MKRIIISSNILWTITQFRLGLIRDLISNNFEIICIADTDNFSSLSENKIADVNAKFIKVPLSRKGINPFYDFFYFLKLCRILKREKPDLVLNYTIKPIIYGSIASFLLGIPSFAITTGLGFVFIKDNLFAKFVKLLYQFSLKFPRKVFFLNRDDYELFIKHKVTSENKCIIIPGEGIDTDYYKPLPKQESSTFKFLLIARLLWDKGIGEYVEAIKILQDIPGIDKVEFLLLGFIDEGNPSGIKKVQIDEWHSKKLIKYLGEVEDARDIIRSVDCVVLPSYREGVPRTLLEAASMGKPIIAADSAGCKDVVDDNINGFLCKTKDYKDLADKMRKMMKLPKEQLNELGNNGRNKVLKEFDQTMVTNIYLSEISNIL
ncbi:MAG: glycosyltransferase family 4 protein [Candidatus Pacearchaeota archaeon]|nr:glycosyltransferase family 4 protein [Candidatus Pacearchaeota archaeon]